MSRAFSKKLPYFLTFVNFAQFSFSAKYQLMQFVKSNTPTANPQDTSLPKFCCDSVLTAGCHRRPSPSLGTSPFGDGKADSSTFLTVYSKIHIVNGNFLKNGFAEARARAAMSLGGFAVETACNQQRFAVYAHYTQQCNYQFAIPRQKSDKVLISLYIFSIL